MAVQWQGSADRIRRRWPESRYSPFVSDGARGTLVAGEDGRSSSTSADIYAQHVFASGVVDTRRPADGAALCVAPGTQNHLTIVSDGAGGAIVTWMDIRNIDSGIDIYAQHVLASGVVDPNWPANGCALCTTPDGQFDPSIRTRPS